MTAETQASGPPVTWPGVLRGLVYEAFDARRTPDARRSCEAIVRAHALWPLVQALPALRQADRLMRERQASRAAAVQLMRSTYPGRVVS